jgi:preprotein translocase subunit SecG
MTYLPLAAGVPLFWKLLSYVWGLAALMLILIILIQKGKGGGLSAAFGGAGAGGVLGTKTGDFLTWVTIGLVVFFLAIAVLMVKFYKPVMSDDLSTTGNSQYDDSAGKEGGAPGAEDAGIGGGKEDLGGDGAGSE